MRGNTDLERRCETRVRPRGRESVCPTCTPSAPASTARSGRSLAKSNVPAARRAVSAPGGARVFRARRALSRGAEAGRDAPRARVRRNPEHQSARPQRRHVDDGIEASRAHRPFLPSSVAPCYGRPPMRHEKALLLLSVPAVALVLHCAGKPKRTADPASSCASPPEAGADAETGARGAAAEKSRLVPIRARGRRCSTAPGVARRTRRDARAQVRGRRDGTERALGDGGRQSWHRTRRSRVRSSPARPRSRAAAGSKAKKWTPKPKTTRLPAPG